MLAVEGKSGINYLLEQVDDEFIEIIRVMLEHRIAQQASEKSKREEELLTKIRRDISTEEQIQLKKLWKKHDANTISDEERAQMLSITDKLEELTAERIQYLKELANLKGKSVKEIMQDLNLRPKNYYA